MVSTSMIYWENMKSDYYHYTTFEKLQEDIGGYIEILSLSDIWAMAFDEEGRLKGSGINASASIIARDYINPGTFIHGTAVVLRKEDIR